MHQPSLRRAGRPFAVLLLVALCGCPGTGGGQGRVGGLDSDGDGFTDQEEREAIPGSDPFNPNDTPLNPIDTDGDGCSDFDELNFADFCDNDPNTDVDELPTGAENTFFLRVARHEDRPLTEREVDGIFRTASDLLRTVQTECPDVATDVSFLRDGDIETFDEANSVVTTEAQLDRLFELPQDFKVVEAMIGVCGAAPSDLTTLLGCAFTNGSVVIIADAPPDVWAHEWGHVQGLGHRDNCARNLMHTSELDTNAVNERERTAFLSPGPKVQFGVGTAARRIETGAGLPELEESSSCASGWERLAGESVETWIERAAGRRYLAGAPVDLASAVARDLRIATGRAAFDGSPSALRRLYSDPRLGHGRANLARLIGLTGEAEAIPELIAAAIAPGGALTRDEFNVRVEALLALGRLASSDPDGAALRFLTQGTDPAKWSEWGVAWSFGSLRGDRLHLLLARLSIMALGLAGGEEATTHLRSLRQRIDAGSLDASRFEDQVDEALMRSMGAQPKSLHGQDRMP